MHTDLVLLEGEIEIDLRDSAYDAANIPAGMKLIGGTKPTSIKPSANQRVRMPSGVTHKVTTVGEVPSRYAYIEVMGEPSEIEFKESNRELEERSHKEDVKRRGGDQDNYERYNETIVAFLDQHNPSLVPSYMKFIESFLGQYCFQFAVNRVNFFPDMMELHTYLYKDFQRAAQNVREKYVTKAFHGKGSEAHREDPGKDAEL